MTNPKSSSEVSKYWCLTLNNYTPEEGVAMDSWPTSYLVVGKEVGESGTAHIQGYFIFSKSMRLSACKKLNPRAHWEVAKGSPAQNREYCSKEGDYYEKGSLPASKGSGNQIRWDLAKAAAMEGRLHDVPDELYVRFYKTLKEIAKDNMVKPDALPSVCGLWIYGTTGTGKSHAVIHAYPNRYIKSNKIWWDGYQGEDVVHMDELSPHHSQWIAPYLLKWADKWPFDAEVKGGAMQIRPKRLIITSNYSIDNMGFDVSVLEAIKRRFVEVEKKKDQNIIV